MQTEVLGIDHVYLAVRSPADSERFYDAVLVEVLGFHKNAFAFGATPHLQYYCRHFAVVIRPARGGAPAHDSETPGLHHLCLRVEAEADVDRVASALGQRGILASAPRYYPQYAPDYYATFFQDPDGIRLEVMNFRQARKAQHAAPG